MESRERQSNFELLRIIALFAVLVFHSNFHTLGYPDFNDVPNHPVMYFSQFVIQGITVICVNVFIILSGWFGIHPSLKGAAKLIYQVLFFMLGSYLFALITGRATLNINDIATTFLLNDYAWFVKAYLCLYILAPILNEYAETAERRSFRNLIIAFYILQSIYGWATNAASFFQYGFSTVSFFGLYLIARYIRRFSPRWSLFSKEKDLFIYLGLVVVAGLMLVGMAYIPQIKPYYFTFVGHMYAYSSPLVIVLCVFFFLFFSKISIKSKIVNFIAASAFSSLFVHGNKFIFPYQEQVLAFYANYPYALAFLMVLGWSLLAFIIAIALDQIRILTWSSIHKWIFKSK